MLSLFFSTISAFIAIRFCIIASYRNLGVFSLFSIIIFSTVTFLLFPFAIKNFEIKNFLILLMILILLFGYDIFLLRKNGFKFSCIRCIAGSFFLVLSLLFIVCAKLPHIYDSKEVMKIKTTKEIKKELSKWKNLNSKETSSELTFHKVILSDMQENVLFDGYITGDIASIRIKLITMPLWMEWIGFPHLWHAECISSDYLDCYDKAKLPHQSIPISHQNTSGWQAKFWTFWEQSFVKHIHPFFISSCTLNSVYIPLTDLDKTPIEKEYTIKLQDKLHAPTLSADQN